MYLSPDLPLGLTLLTCLSEIKGQLIYLIEECNVFAPGMMDKLAHLCVCWKSLRRVAKGLLSEVQSFAVTEAHNLVVCKTVLKKILSQLGVAPG